ncbi:unnamed protein product [Cuscuta europaea]|uniref:Uncharacterized protein n=1 Tax=Cuscuta europaea TaxID=41803 RepID=A0A9P1EHR5_CUSEU|nr:unnamed protein product [Cuscuta europaea]
MVKKQAKVPSLVTDSNNVVVVIIEVGDALLDPNSTCIRDAIDAPVAPGKNVLSAPVIESAAVASSLPVTESAAAASPLTDLAINEAQTSSIQPAFEPGDAFGVPCATGSVHPVLSAVSTPAAHPVLNAVSETPVKAAFAPKITEVGAPCAPVNVSGAAASADVSAFHDTAGSAAQPAPVEATTNDVANLQAENLATVLSNVAPNHVPTNFPVTVASYFSVLEADSPSEHTDAPCDDTIRAEVFVQHPMAHDETLAATLNVAVTEVNRDRRRKPQRIYSGSNTKKQILKLKNLT